jgi:hypothetical protein
MISKSNKHAKSCVEMAAGIWPILIAVCAAKIRRLFSLEHLVKDRDLLTGLTPELWFPLKSLMRHKSIRKLTYSRSAVKKALADIEYDYDSFTDMIQPRIEIPQL